MQGIRLAGQPRAPLPENEPDSASAASSDTSTAGDHGESPTRNIDSDSKPGKLSQSQLVASIVAGVLGGVVICIAALCAFGRL